MAFKYPIDGKTLRPLTDVLALDDAADNSAAISASNGEVRNVILYDRTLYKDGAWNTLCLPFDLDIAGSPLDGDGVDVRTLNSSDFQDGTLTLNFTPAPGQTGAVTTLLAGLPYIIKWNNTGQHLTENDLLFWGVIVPYAYTSAEAINAALASASSPTTYVDFIGTYSPLPLYESTDEKHNLYLGADNTLYYPTAEDFQLKPFRGYFVLKNGLTVGESGAHVRAFNLNFGDGDEAQGITTTDYTDLTDKAGAWYTINGVRLDGVGAGPVPARLRKGLYIHGGKKVVVP